MAAGMPQELASRDQRILLDLQRVRLLSGGQLERLHFVGVATSGARGSARRRTMARLMAAGLVTRLPRRVGGERAGSSGLVYTLDARGQRWLDSASTQTPSGRVRRPWSVGWPFVQHTLDVAELYVRLREREQAGLLQVRHFAAEPASWYRAGSTILKPDAWAVIESTQWEEHYWLEVDRATESLPTLRRKLLAYVDFAAGGGLGPSDLVPQVLVSVSTPARQHAVVALVESLPPPAEQLIQVHHFPTVFAEPARPPP